MNKTRAFIWKKKKMKNQLFQWDKRRTSQTRAKEFLSLFLVLARLMSQGQRFVQREYNGIHTNKMCMCLYLNRKLLAFHLSYTISFDIKELIYDGFFHI